MMINSFLSLYTLHTPHHYLPGSFGQQPPSLQTTPDAPNCGPYAAYSGFILEANPLAAPATASQTPFVLPS